MSLKSVLEIIIQPVPCQVSHVINIFNLKYVLFFILLNQVPSLSTNMVTFRQTEEKIKASRNLTLIVIFSGYSEDFSLLSTVVR
jgi:hypothetical protein